MNHVQLLLSKSKKNQVECAECKKQIKEAHLICFRYYKKNNSPKPDDIYLENMYTVGCTHADWDGESWCDDCVTIADQKILCSSCGNLDWGVPTSEGYNRKYMWNDGSESCFNDLL